ncbi:MAG: peptidylprolyl isomerase [Bacteroidaceae bacterium]|nr:peptidylprolyl isomerase [Bacteroidaceae bacterium]
MRRAFITCLLMAFVTVVLAQDNPVVMNVAGYDVTRSEFEYFLQKNCVEDTLDFKTISKYADLYVNFKLKVAAAKSAGIDTTAAFINEYKSYRDIYADKILVDSTWLETRAKDLYHENEETVGPQGYYDVSMISLLPEDEKEESIKATGMHLFERRQAILDGEVSFSEVAKQESYDILAEDGGYMGWITRTELPGAVADQLFMYGPDTLTMPIWTEYGWLMFEIRGQKAFEPYEEQRSQIMQWMHDNGYDRFAKYSTANKYARNHGWEVRDEEALSRLDSILEEAYPDFGNVSMEYHDGLLLFEISNRKIWNSISSDTTLLEKWFDGHRNDYVFDKPVFKGCIMMCASEDIYNEVVKVTEGVNLEQLKSRIDEYDPEHIKVHAQYGPFRKGANSYCDAIVFGEGQPSMSVSFPYTGYIGRVLETPEVWTDVPGAVISDAQDAAEKAWVKELRKQYGFKLYKKELKVMCTE